MGLHVDEVDSTVTELSTTLCTLCDFLPSVETTVCLETTSLRKHLLTYITSVWSHSSMDAVNVSGEIALLSECLIAVFTAKQTLSSVRHTMTVHVICHICVVITHFTPVSALSADVTVLLLDMTFQLLLSDTLVWAVVAAQRATNY